MKVEQEQLALMKNIELLCREVIMAIEYGRRLDDFMVEESSPDEIGNDFWIFCKNSCASIGITKWCSIFGSEKSEKTYWERASFLNKEHLKKLILETLNLSEGQWNEKRDKARRLRDKFIAHNDYKQSAPNLYKDLGPLKESATILRDELINLFKQLESDDEDSRNYLAQITLVRTSDLEVQLQAIYKLAVKNANKYSHKNVAKNAAPPL